MPDFGALFQNLQQAMQLMSYAMVVLVVAPLFPFLYVVMRWRAPGTGHTGIGTLGAVHYFLVMALLLMLAGAANLTYGLVSITPIDPVLTRISWGTFFASLLFLGLNFGLLRFTRDLSDLPDVRRMFVGFFLVIAGLTAFSTLLLFFVAWFQEVDPEVKDAAVERADTMKLYGAWIFYFLTAYLAATWWLTRTAPASPRPD
ncbi:MAG: hypothetical protein ACYTGZ_17425 [Planctomycetota bacterium]|jgi:hypothetical protein